MYPDSHLVFKHGETQDERCKADQISEKVAILVGTLGLSENVPGMGLVLFYAGYQIRMDAVLYYSRFS